jgi:signal peptidase I
MLGRWLLGCLLVLVCGWGLLLLAFYLTRSLRQSPELAVGITAAFNLVLFLFLERNFWLSRFMGLRIEPGSHSWHSALMLWLMGVPGLLFRSTNFHPQAEAQADTRVRTRPQVPPRGDSAREIVETIVFVVVLVLLLKSFAAEAFVIPTGSMAPTLYGNQKLITCPECGYVYPVNCSQEAEPQHGQFNVVGSGTCENCRYHMTLTKDEHDADGRRIEVANPAYPCHSGDRVLVAKFLYDLPWRSPQRLDVVVFKYPGDGDRPFPDGGPSKDYTPINYIKRLIGLSGETIAICNGKLYALSPADSAEWVKKHESDPRVVETNPSLKWRRRNMYEDVSEARERFAEGKFAIIRKSPSKILSMSRVVNVNDDQPADLKGPKAEHWEKPAPHWKKVGPWKSDDEKKYTSDGATGWLRYENILRDSKDGKKSLITDFLSYNSGNTDAREHWVGDLIVTCEVTVQKAEGEFLLELSKGHDRFRAVWDLKTGICRLVRVEDYTAAGKKAGDEGIELKQQATTLNRPGTYTVRLANVDDRLTVWVDGKLPFDDGVEYTPAHKISNVVRSVNQAPTKNDLEPASIGVRSASVSVAHLRLDRDTYYSVYAGNKDSDQGDKDPGLGNTDLANPDAWNIEVLTKPPLKTLYVQPGHYLCLGDNSSASSDGRTWGLVPERLLLGRALVIYYPFKLNWWPLNNPVNRVGPIH